MLSREEGRLAVLWRYELLDTPEEPAFDQITRLAAKLLHVPIALPVSINTAMLDLGANDFADQIAAMLDRPGVQGGLDRLRGDGKRADDRAGGGRPAARPAAPAGIDVEIDDFGTGQSALSYLKDIPATAVKIDQRFIRSIATERSDQIMVCSTIDLAHDLGYRVVAEGVETVEAYEWLRQHRCDLGQGDLISRPLAAGAFRPTAVVAV
ncbi:EAL domain-containing protein [Azospirillum sp. INR13]|uniref:EAL domain-containing protein n=1 Tax=Azospirillum sp. INR13 TaxID=2596919 RepID=UPI00189267B2|nr:EAL domain-containing protein [Azospirillum sp. INR13]